MLYGHSAPPRMDTRKISPVLISKVVWVLLVQSTHGTYTVDDIATADECRKARIAVIQTQNYIHSSTCIAREKVYVVPRPAARP